MENPWIVFWVIFAVILMIAEVILPGLIAVFFGIAALIVAGGLWIGAIKSVASMLTWWMVTSVVLLLTIRNVFAKLVPGDQWVDDIGDDSKAIGTIVSVLEEIGPEEKEGRIEYRGTTWSAKSSQGEKIPKNSQVQIVKRDGLHWIVQLTQSGGFDG